MFFHDDAIREIGCQMRLLLFSGSGRNIEFEVIVPVDGDLDGLLTVGIVFRRNSLWRSGRCSGLPRRTVGACWFAIVRCANLDAIRSRTQTFLLRNLELTIRNV